MARPLSRKTRGPRSRIGGPLLSVIVTSYRLDRLADIKELLDSLQAQTHSNLEVIFVGEGTRDLGQEVVAYGRQQAAQLARRLRCDQDGIQGEVP